MNEQARDGMQGVETDRSAWEPRAREDGAGTLAATLPRTKRERTARRASGTCALEPAAEPREESTETLGPHAILVAGDHGWGGGLFDRQACRPLLELAGRPLIVHALDWLRAQGIRTAGVCANSNTTAVRRCLGDGQEFGLSLQYYCDVMPRGPAGCIRDAAGDSQADAYLVISGMVVPRFEVADLLLQHRQTRACATIVSCPAPTGGLEPAGLYVFSPEVLDRISTTGYQDIKETLLPQLRRCGRRVGLYKAAREDVLSVTDAGSYMQANRLMIEQMVGTPGAYGPDYVRMGDAWVHRACVVHPDVRFIGPSIVGPGCTIEAGVIVVGPTSIGQACHIEAGAVLSRSTLWSFSRVGHGSVVDNCLMTRSGELQAGCQVRNTCWPVASHSTGRNPAPR